MSGTNIKLPGNMLYSVCGILQLELFLDYFRRAPHLSNGGLHGAFPLARSVSAPATAGSAAIVSTGVVTGPIANILADDVSLVHVEGSTFPVTRLEAHVGLSRISSAACLV